jgi:ABC-type enterochelin transport system permease subunit
MTHNTQAVVLFVVVGIVVFVITALVGPWWLATVLAAVAAGLATFAVGRTGRHEAER